MTSPVRVLVLGSGGIGTLIAARLAVDPQVQVSLAVRRPTPSVVLVGDGEERVAPVEIVTDVAGLAPFDWVVVATKAYDVPGLADWFAAPACRGARYLVAQNGVEHAERLAPWIEVDRVLPAIVTYGAERTAPGRVAQTLSGVVRLPQTPLAQAFSALAAGGALNVEVTAEFAVALWTKLAHNLASNSLTTIADVSVREVALRPGLRAAAIALVAECRAVAAAVGVRLDERLTEEMLTLFASFPATVHSSMWQDRQAGRRFEHDAISGALVRIGEAWGVATPRVHLTTCLLDGLEMGY
ncbi:ketopantoate reductase family protein [Nocardioides sp. Bht2]|uniref:ketopantoate reductase family protein n=1 Tax=Nocardioides sp. Bht2 TaxID=3392297 RepID=UPI0039B43249